MESAYSRSQFRQCGIASVLCHVGEIVRVPPPTATRTLGADTKPRIAQRSPLARSRRRVLVSSLWNLLRRLRGVPQKTIFSSCDPSLTYRLK